MLTSRGWWFLFFVILQCFFGMLLVETIGPILGIIGFTLLAWFLLQWSLFAFRVLFVLPKLRLHRQLKANRKTVPVIWSGQEFDVIVELRLPEYSLPFVRFQDRPPSGCDRIEGLDYRSASFAENEPVRVTYRLRCDTPGEIRFEGVRIQIADLQGFFYHRDFVRQPKTYPVLPPLSDAEGKRRTTKSHNVLPPPGAHRLRRSGGGGELHDLREYRPGDPPRMIAWKPSARRDKMIIKEFESDVPVRCTLFLDASQSVRIGITRETMLNQLTVLASAIAQASLAERDLIGLTVFDENEAEILPPNRNSRHLIVLLKRLAEAGNAPVVSPTADLDAMVQLATPLAYELYPDLMNRNINTAPLKAFWEPILDYPRKAFWIFLLCLPLFLMVGYLAVFAAAFCLEAYEEAKDLLEAGENVYDFLDEAFWPIVIVSSILSFFGTLWWIGHGLGGWFPPWYPMRRRRKQLAAFLSCIDRSPLGMESRLLDDDTYFADRIQRFLAHHHRRYPVALYDDEGRYLFRSAGKIEVLAKALLNSVARGRDNELFIIMADLIELDSNLEPLLKAMRVAVARHHQVLVICPWMPGVPLLDEQLTSQERRKRIRKEAKRQRFRGLTAELYMNTVQRYHQAHRNVRLTFARMGIVVIPAQKDDSVRLILNRMDRLRGVGGRR